MKCRFKWMASAVMTSLVMMVFFHVQTYLDFSKKKLQTVHQIELLSAVHQAQTKSITEHIVEREKIDVEREIVEMEREREKVESEKVFENTPPKLNQPKKDKPLITSPIPKTTSTKTFVRKTKVCEEYPSELRGNLTVNSRMTYSLDEALTAAGGQVFEGCYEPKDCFTRQRVAIVIPYKDRYEHLLTLLYHLNPILQRQKMNYCIFVAEQYDDGVFNKARVMNAAYVDITNRIGLYKSFDCFIFHDVDMLPENDYNIYKCGNSPKHLSSAIDKFNYTIGYGTQFGGVTAIRREHYLLVNGHSNQYWGWGGEDNDMERRIFAKNLSIIAADSSVGRFKMIRHDHPWWFNPDTGVGSHVTMTKELNKDITSTFVRNIPIDDSGVSNLKYVRMETDNQQLWNKITYDIRDYEVTKVSVRMLAVGKTAEIVEVKNPTPGEKTSEKVDPQKLFHGSSQDKNHCDPSYIQLKHMTINRTLGNAEAYTKIYYDLDQAKEECNKMTLKCRGIVEQKRGTFSLRSTALVHENVLTYNYGIEGQCLVKESHHSTAVYVKICPKNPTYTQIFPEPFVIFGDERSGLPPRFQVEFDMTIYNDYKTQFSFHYKFATTHRVAMDRRFSQDVIPNTWWDSLGNTQRGMRTLSPDSSEQHGHVQILKFKTPMTNLVRQPGCYVASGTLMDENNRRTIMQWEWWFQIRAQTEELEEAFTKRALQNSIRVGAEYRKLLEERKKAMERAKQRQQKEIYQIKMQKAKEDGKNLFNKQAINTNEFS